MGRTYSLSTFLRQTPNDQVRDYCRKKDILADLDFAWLRLPEFQPVLERILGLPDETRKAVEEDFQAVFALADARGTRTMLEQASLRGLDLSERFAAMQNHYQRAMWLLLNEAEVPPGLFETCAVLARVSALSFPRSRQLVGLPTVEPAHDEATIAAMSADLSAHYRAQSRGQRCAIVYYLKPSPPRDCFVVYSEDHTTTGLRFEGTELRRQRIEGVFEVVYVFLRSKGVLDVSGDVWSKDVPELQSIFCRRALGLPAIPAQARSQYFDLAPLAARDFPFRTDPEDHIERVEVVGLTVRPRGNTSSTIMLSRDGGDPNGFFDAYSGMRVGFPAGLDVCGARLRVVWYPNGGGRKPQVTFSLTQDSCGLKDEPTHETVRRYLREWGIG